MHSTLPYPPASELKDCDVVMKGGVTSGVVYPLAICEIARTYRLRGVGGASAGAIGAAFAAAAECGRDDGGFERLETIPQSLTNGRLASLFQPQPQLAPLFRLLISIAPQPPTEDTLGEGPHPRRRSGARQVGIVAGTAIRAFPFSAAIGVAPGGAVLALALQLPATYQAVTVSLVAVLVAAIGLVVALLIRAGRMLLLDVPRNFFGLCTGRSTSTAAPGLIEWLHERIQDLCGRPNGQPLTFGDLQAQGIDLRMVTTCLSEGAPYELPHTAREFYFDVDAWSELFPPAIIEALLYHPPRLPSAPASRAYWEWVDECARTNTPRLARLPDADDLPILVATRLSLSFPLLISAVPLWEVDMLASADALRTFRDRFRTGDIAGGTGDRVTFAVVWFTDGGFCSNFPMPMFDEAMSIRPTFAISLMRRPKHADPAAQAVDIHLPDESMPSRVRIDLPRSGAAALPAFLSAAFTTARDWHDNAYLKIPAHRSRVVQILHGDMEGGLNLHMPDATLTNLADRGAQGARALVERFSQPFPDSDSKLSGWELHQWVRYRSLLDALPRWLATYALGRQAMAFEESDATMYPMKEWEASLAHELDQRLLDAAKLIASDRRRGSFSTGPAPTAPLKQTPPMNPRDATAWI